MKYKFILPIAAVLLLLCGITLLATQLYTPNSDVIKEITLKDTEITSEILEFSASGLKPGDVREYTINLNGKSAGSYNLNFDFAIVKDGTLKNFVDVTLQQGKSSYTYKLSELLNGKTVSFTCNIGINSATAIKIIYSMSIDIGNEAQNATADFAINLTAEKF